MINITKVISTRIESLKRLVKILRNGKNDVQEVTQYSPAGFDSAPIKDAIAVYVKSQEDGKMVVFGYLAKSQVNPGEVRLYSMNEAGSEMAYIYMTDDGKIHLNGNIDNLMRYQAAETQLQNLVTAINAELVKIQTGITGVGGVYAPVTITLDLSSAKIDELKTS